MTALTRDQLTAPIATARALLAELEEVAAGAVRVSGLPGETPIALESLTPEQAHAAAQRLLEHAAGVGLGGVFAEFLRQRAADPAKFVS